MPVPKSNQTKQTNNDSRAERLARLNKLRNKAKQQIPSNQHVEPVKTAENSAVSHNDTSYEQLQKINAKLYKANTHGKKRLHDVEIQLTGERKRNKKLAKENQELQRQRKQAEAQADTVAQLQAQVADLQAELDQANNNSAIFAQEKLERGTQIAELEDKLSEMSKQRDRYRTYFTNTKNELADAKAGKFVDLRSKLDHNYQLRINKLTARHKAEYDSLKIKYDKARVALSQYRQDRRKLDELSQAPMPYMLAGSVRKINSKNYLMYANVVDRLFKRWNNVVSDVRHADLSVPRVVGHIEERDADLWFVTDTFKTRFVDTLYKLVPGDTYTALQMPMSDHTYRATIIRHVKEKNIVHKPTEAERQLAYRQNNADKRVGQAISLSVPQYEELASKQVGFFGYNLPTYLKNVIEQSGGEITWYETGETSNRAVKTALKSNKLDYVLVNVNDTSHETYWTVKDWTKEKESNLRKTDMYAGTPNPVLIANMRDYFIAYT